jgi:RimJ/RimL family protein N-acetyltransferase
MTEKQPTLTSQRLILRPFWLSDAPVVQQLAGDRAIASTTLTIPHPFNDGLAEDWINSLPQRFEWGQLATFAVVRQADEVLLGSVSIGINRWHDHGELDYWIGQPYWGQGYATEAVAVLIGYAFTGLALHRVHAYVFKRNAASSRVLQKLGLVYEGCLRQHVKKWGVYEDVVVYGLVPPQPSTKPDEH